MQVDAVSTPPPSSFSIGGPAPPGARSLEVAVHRVEFAQRAQHQALGAAVAGRLRAAIRSHCSIASGTGLGPYSAAIA